ncbi:MAG: hypothetical protein JNM00_03490 [Flavobacteriales bacterium]|nr:hypothetical protein [Flavobacteriales bacterium]
MKRFEYILIILAVTGLIMRICLIPGGAMLMILSATLLSLFYMWFGFAFFNKIGFTGIFKRNSYKGGGAHTQLPAIAMGMALALMLLSILFKLQLWQGSFFLFLQGIVLGVIVFVIVLILHLRSKAPFSGMYFSRLMVYGILAIGIYLTPASSLVDVFYRHQPEYAELYKQMLANPGDPALEGQLRDLRWKMDLQRREEIRSRSADTRGNE